MRFKSIVSRPLIALVVLIAVMIPFAASAENRSAILDRSKEQLNTIFHTGVWVEDIEEMLNFLDMTMDFEILVRVERRGGGERLILKDGSGQLIELLSAPGEVRPHPDMPLHPRGRVAGIAHISIWVKDAAALEKEFAVMGYEILGRVPEDYSDGYISFEGKEYRILFVRGPGAMTFELFDVRD